MIVPDINLLIYAYDSTSPFHERSVTWWQTCLSETEPVGIPHVVLFGFIRISTNARVFQNPMSLAETANHVRLWLERTHVAVLDPGPKHFEQSLALLELAGTGGNLVSDVQIASLTIDSGAVLHTADTDFVRFPELNWFNPITGQTSRNTRKNKA